MADLILDDHGWEVIRKSGKRGASGNVRIRTSPSSFSLDIARGNITGFTSEIVNAHNLDISKTAREDIWDDTGAYPFQTVAFTPVASSSNTNDTLLGTGARTIEIRGITLAGDAITSSVDLDGTNEVTFSDAIVAINKVSVTAVGNTGFNEGDVTVLTVTAGTTVAKIIAQLNETLSSIRTVPNGEVYYISSLYGSILPTLTGTGLKEGELIFQVSKSGIFMPIFAATMAKTGTSKFIHMFDAIPKAIAGDKIKMEFISHQNNTKIVAGYEIYIEDVS